jgi:NOL1/NOP2/fmu family ribosome biogenesis protein
MTKILDEKTRRKLVNYLNSRFDIDSCFFDNYIFTISGHSVSIIFQTKETRRIIENQLKQNFTISFGIELFSNYKDYTPSSLGFGIFNKEQITQNYIELNREHANDYFSGKVINLKESKNYKVLSSGFVVCLFDSFVIGTALFEKNTETLKPNLSFVNDKIK